MNLKRLTWKRVQYSPFKWYTDIWLTKLSTFLPFNSKMNIKTSILLKFIKK